MESEAISGSIGPLCGLLGLGFVSGSSTLTHASQQDYLFVSRSGFQVGCEGADNANWASFSASWECCLELHDFGELIGNVAVREKEKQKRAFYLRTLHIRDNARAQEFMIRRKAEKTAAGKDLSGGSVGRFCIQNNG